MIYEELQEPYFKHDFGIGSVTFLPNYDGSPEDHAVVVTIAWDAEADEEEVSQRLETWAGLPDLPWFRFHLKDSEEGHRDPAGDGGGLVELRGYCPEDWARSMKGNSTVYAIAYGDRVRRDGR